MRSGNYAVYVDLQPPLQYCRLPQLATIYPGKAHLRIGQQLFDAGTLIEPAPDAGIRLKDTPYQFENSGTSRAGELIKGPDRIRKTP